MTIKRGPAQSKAPPKPTRRHSPADDYDLASSLGNETSDDDGVTIGVMANGHAVFLPQSLRNATPKQQELARRLQLTVIQRQKLMEEASRLVQQLRRAGVSWSGIGWSVGTTAEAARQRWGNVDAPH